VAVTLASVHIVWSCMYITTLWRNIFLHFKVLSKSVRISQVIQYSACTIRTVPISEWKTSANSCKQKRLCKHEKFLISQFRRYSRHQECSMILHYFHVQHDHFKLVCIMYQFCCIQSLIMFRQHKMRVSNLSTTFLWNNFHSDIYWVLS
jgi:hypothetical protein